MLCMIYKIFTLLPLGRECQHAPPAKEIRKFPKDFKCLWGVAVARGREREEAVARTGLVRHCAISCILLLPVLGYYDGC